MTGKILKPALKPRNLKPREDRTKIGRRNTLRRLTSHNAGSSHSLCALLPWCESTGAPGLGIWGKHWSGYRWILGFTNRSDIYLEEPVGLHTNHSVDLCDYLPFSREGYLCSSPRTAAAAEVAFQLAVLYVYRGFWSITCHGPAAVFCGRLP